MPKKSQVTLFIVLGLVIFLVFGLMFYITTFVKITKLKAQADRIVEDLLETTALKYYVDLCVDKSLKEGLKLIGDQGGRIYQYQPGSIYRTPQRYVVFSEGDKSYHVSYGIANDTSWQGVTPPKYPCRFNDPGGPAYCGFINDPEIFPVGDYYFAINNLPFLCSETGTYCGTMSIEEQLESYVSNRTKDCVDFESIVGINETFNVTEGDIITNITIGDSGITAIVDFPLSIQIGGYRPIVKIIQFSAHTDNRLKQMYKWIFDIVRKETKNLNHNIEVDSKKSPYYSPEFTLQKVEDVYKNDDVIIVTDSNPAFDLKGELFSFRFAVENMYPILDYIPPVNPPNQRYDLIVIEDHTITIDPKAYDLNEDNNGNELMTKEYKYSGWEEDYGEYFDFTGCEANPKDCSDYPEKYVKKDIQRGAPHNWTESDAYKGTARKATCTPDHDDIGPHNLTVKVSDGVLEDYQIIRILVDDEIKAYASGNNHYGDIPNNLASIEDPYWLIAKYTDFINPGQVSFRWTDRKEIPATLYEGNMPEIKIPMPTDIKGMEGPFSVIDKHSVKLTVISGESSDADTLNIDVKACLPHRSSSFSFPYNNITNDDKWGGKYSVKEDNPFQADHTCCHSSDPNDPGWGTVEGTDKTCYESVVEYGCRFAAFTDVQTEARANLPTLPNPTITLAAGDDNDIISRQITRKCSEERGNVCDGAAIDKRTLYKECGELGTDESERCSGCSRTPATSPPKGCENFYLTTFESRVLGSGTGRCNQNLKCSPGKGDNNYDAGGTFGCKATCDGKGNCDFATDCECYVGCGADEACNKILESQLPRVVDSCKNNIQQRCDTRCKASSTGICKTIPGVASCNAPVQCNGKEPYHKEINKGWCYNGEGCDAWCTTEIVNLGLMEKGFGDKFDKCGCTGYDGKECDSNFDGVADGICVSGICAPKSQEGD